MEYIRRVVDDEIDRKTEAFNAVSILVRKGVVKRELPRNVAKRLLSSRMRIKEMDTLLWQRRRPSFF